MRLIFDIETNGFLSEATKIHSIVIKDIDTKQLYSYHGDKIGRGLYLLSGASLLVGHNILKFDIPSFFSLNKFCLDPFLKRLSKE